MRILNLFLIILLCLAIPLQGANAAVPAFGLACPADSATAADLKTVQKPDCCNDAKTVEKTGKTCKAEQDCQTGSPLLLNQLINPLRLYSAGIGKTFTNTTYLSIDGFAAWRPPTQF